MEKLKIKSVALNKINEMSEPGNQAKSNSAFECFDWNLNVFDHLEFNRSYLIKLDYFNVELFEISALCLNDSDQHPGLPRHSC